LLLLLSVLLLALLAALLPWLQLQHIAAPAAAVLLPALLHAAPQPLHVPAAVLLPALLHAALARALTLQQQPPAQQRLRA
jgi:hypothetical protein